MRVGRGDRLNQNKPVNLWSQRLLRDWIDNKWGGAPAALWDLATIISITLGAAGLGFLWTTGGGISGLRDILVIALWAGAGLAAGCMFVVWRRPS